MLYSAEIMQQNLNSTSIYFVSGFFPDQIKTEITENSTSNIQSAADTLQKAMYNGFNEIFKNLTIINSPFTGAFPFKYRKLFISSCYYRNIYSIGYFNLVAIKRLVISFKIYRLLRSELKKKSTHKPIYIIVYSIQLHHLLPVLKIKRNNPQIKIVLIVPDLLENMAGYNSLIYETYKAIEIKYFKKILKEIDKFVFLSEHMNDYFKVDSRDYVVIEGIYDNSNHRNIEPSCKNKRKIILYSGGLYEKYGILNLINAFKTIPDEDIQLILCGSGDCVDSIKSQAILDSRIKYLGIIDRNQVLEIQQQSMILVNPRTPTENFTKYSFPSKTMEYLASGSVVIMYRLDGIPKEYHDYFITPDNYSCNALADSINKVLYMTEEERYFFGKKAKDFILSNKNPLAQCKKILKLIN